MARKVQPSGISPDDADRLLLALAGRRIRVLRRRAKMKQADLAAAIGTGQSYVVAVEAGDQNLTLKILNRIASSLGVAPAVLLLEGEMALAADEGGFDNFDALLSSAMKASDHVAHLLREMQALTSTKTSRGQSTTDDSTSENII